VDKGRRKQIAQEYRARQRSQGVFVVRCAITGEAWISSTRNLDTSPRL
jgi:hypothetical protein